MITVHCVDVSRSMYDDQLDEVQREVFKRFKPKDIVVLFSIDYHVVTDLERPFKSYPHEIRGGTWAEPVLEFAKRQGKAILYSDGYLNENDKAQFDEFVKV